MKYLIDTDWVIDHLRREPKVSTRLEELSAEGLAMSIVSLAELYEGILYSRDPAKSEEGLRRFLHPDIAILGLDDATCRLFGNERGRLRRDGKAVGDMDLLIASTCLQHNLTLLTNNRRHFEVIEGLEIVSV